MAGAMEQSVVLRSDSRGERLQKQENLTVKLAEVILDSTKCWGLVPSRRTNEAGKNYTVVGGAIVALDEWARAKNSDMFDLTESLVPEGWLRMKALDSLNLAQAVFGVEHPDIEVIPLGTDGAGASYWRQKMSNTGANEKLVEVLKTKFSSSGMSEVKRERDGVCEFVCPTVLAGVVAEVKTRVLEDFLEKLNAGKGTVVFEYVRLKFTPEALGRVQPLPEKMKGKLTKGWDFRFEGTAAVFSDTEDPLGYLRVLGVPPDTSKEGMGLEIKRAYRKLAKELHPDLGHRDETSQERLRKVIKAYEFLSDPQNLRQYGSRR